MKNQLFALKNITPMPASVQYQTIVILKLKAYGTRTWDEKNQIGNDGIDLFLSLPPDISNNLTNQTEK